MITVVGSLNLDSSVTTPRFAAPGETLIATGLVAALGGKGANQAVAAARAGAPVSFIGAVGHDSAGDFGVDALTSEGINATEVRRVQGVHTGAAIVLVSADGENSIYVVPGANHELGPEAVEAGWFAESSVVVMQGELRADTTSELVAQAAAAGSRVILNLAPPLSLSPATLKQVDILVVNVAEAAEMLDEAAATVLKAPAAAAAKLAQQARAAIITIGSGGVVWDSAGSRGHLPAHAVNVVDTTGAGDAFTGNLATAIWRGTPLPEAISWANSAAALAVTRSGAADAMPRLEETTAWVEANGTAGPA